MIQRRKLSRVPSGLSAVVQWRNNKADGVVRDLSFTGIFLEMDEEIPSGQGVVISISLETTNASLNVVLQAKAIRRDYDGMAFQFGSIELDSFSTLRQLILYNSEDPANVEREFQNYISSKVKRLRGGS